MRTNKSPWTQGEKATLLASLDYYIKEEKHDSNRQMPIILKKISKRIRARSVKQIKQQLFAIWRASNLALRSAASKPPFQRLFEQGSRCLKGLPEDLKILIGNELKAIQLDEASKTPRTLRSGKERSISVDANRQTPSHYVSRTNTPTKQGSSFRQTTSSHQSLLVKIEKSCKGNGQLADRAEDVSSFADCAASHRQEEVVLEHSSKVGLYSDPLINVNAGLNAAPIEIADSFQSMSDVAFETPETTNSSTSSSIARRRWVNVNDGQQYPAMSYDDLDDDSLMSKPYNRLELYENLSNLLRDNKHFRWKCKQLEQDSECLKRRERSEKGLNFSARNDPNFSIHKHIQDQDEKIAELTRSLENHALLKRYLEASRYTVETPDLKEIRNAFVGMGSALNCLPEIANAQCGIDMTRSDPKTSNFLIKRFAMGGLPPAFQATEMPNFLLQSLTAAAICEWVFLTEVNCAVVLSTPILESYRNHLKILCGEDGLCRLDIAAHRSIFHDEDFKQVYISKPANKLAIRFWNFVSEICLDGVLMARQNNLEHVKNAFYHALLIKYELMLCKSKFDIVWPVRDSVFEESLMEIVPAEMVKISHDCAGAFKARVQCATMPGLQLYMHDRKRVEDQVFFEFGEERSGSPIPIAKALVSIR